MASSTVNTSGAISRMSKEIAHIQKGTDLSLAVAFRESDIRNLHALIVGPPETPYEFGFFEFEVQFGEKYPIKAPKVRCITTNGGQTRFNPNIYAEGTVCLSILGTWRGESGEEWSSAQGLESVLLSIQSLMSSNPYENEPGFEHSAKTDPNPQAYVAKIRHETLRIAVIQRLEGLLGITPEKLEPPRKKHRKSAAASSSASAPPSEPAKSPSSLDGGGGSTPATDVSAHEYDAEATFHASKSGAWDPFADVMKQRFLWYYDSYIKAVDTHETEQKDGSRFTHMEFEYGANSMAGKFDYRDIRARLQAIKKALDDERASWERQGTQKVTDSTRIATQLAFQFKQLRHKWNEQHDSGARLEISLRDAKNPFVWELSFFGEPMTNLDGGIWRITFAISPQFPEVRPHVIVETPIYHHRVSKGTGILCYFPEKEDEIDSHLHAIVTALVDEKPTYDPRANVHPEAFQLYWGGEESRKKYNRLLRKSAQESCEY